MAKRTDHQIAIDDALTKDLCRYDEIYDYMAHCANELRRQFADNRDVFYYVKGSAALARYLRNAGLNEDRINRLCARSDWDTQLVINPLLPAKEWFTAFKAVEQTLIESLRRFEDGLLVVFAGFKDSGAGAPPEALADPGVPQAKNDLGKDLRADIGKDFGEVFLATSRHEHFDQPGHDKFWNVEWDNVNQLDRDDTRKDILDLDIQGHNQATLTWGMVHPGQAMANLYSVTDAAEARALKQATEAEAAETWNRLDAAADEYEALELQLIEARPGATEFLQKKLSEALSDATFIRNLPPEAFTAPIESMLEQDGRLMSELWRNVQQAKADAQLAVQAHEAEPGDLEKEEQADDATEYCVTLEMSFAWNFIAWLRKNPEARQRLYEWCLRNVFDNRELRARLADEHYEELRKLLTEEDLVMLRAAEDRIDREFEAYHEDVDPEDAAEAEKQRIERFAPFALVEQQKGGRRIASILENLTIRDFYLYRLMIRCQLSNKNQDLRLLPEAPPDKTFDEFKQGYKFRAELLDISVPRNDSLETAEQWHRVRPQIAPDDQGIPLPKGDYFIDEYVLMFREVLDKKSSSAHKFSKRLWRACLIAEAFVAELQRAGELDDRINSATTYFPMLRELLALRTPGAIVLMRMCEQLIESYELTANERLRADTGVVMEAMGKPLRRIVTAELTDKTFLELMEVFAHVGKSVYHHQFVLADNRRRLMPDEALSTLTGTVRDAIVGMFADSDVPCRCAVVENFAIVADPDLPPELKESVPMDSINLVVYTNTAGAELLPRIEQVVTPLVRPESPEVPPPAMDVVRHDRTVYVRLTEAVTDPLISGEAAPALLMTIQGVADDSRANWVAPGHVHDLNGILGHYRRTLSRYSEYYVQSQTKRILQELEIALTTY